MEYLNLELEIVIIKMQNDVMVLASCRHITDKATCWQKNCKFL